MPPPAPLVTEDGAPKDGEKVEVETMGGTNVSIPAEALPADLPPKGTLTVEYEIDPASVDGEMRGLILKSITLLDGGVPEDGPALETADEAFEKSVPKDKL